MFEQGPNSRNATCSTHMRMEEEDADEQEEANSTKDEADEIWPMKITPNSDNKTETIEECSEEGGAVMTVQDK